MNDSNAPEHLDAKDERSREQRIEGIKRWIEYIESEPPETWGAPAERNRQRPTRCGPERTDIGVPSATRQ